MGRTFSTRGGTDLATNSDVGVPVVLGASPPPNDMGVSVVSGEADIRRGEEVSVGAMAASAGACVGAGAAVAAGAASCAADMGAAAPNAAGAGAVARAGAVNVTNPLTTNVTTNKNVANTEAKRKTGTRRGVGGLTPAICGVNVKLRGARREGS